MLLVPLQALLKNARASQANTGSLAELSPDADVGIGTKGLLHRWTQTPAHKTYSQAYAEGKLSSLCCGGGIGLAWR